MKFADMHCDTIYVLSDMRDAGDVKSGLRKNSLHIDLERLRSAGYILQNFALFAELSTCGDPWARFCQLADVYDGELSANADIAAPVLRYDDISKNADAGKLSAMLTVEEGAVCKGDIEKLRAIYERGVRMLTLTWNFENELGSPNMPNVGMGQTMRLTVPETHKGLKERGVEFVREMERLGMIVDVSHLSDAGFWDVCRYSTRPFVASHSNARAVSPCVRNLTDDMIRALAERGGVTGLNFCPDFLQLGGGDANELRRAICDHAKHIINVGGEDVLGLGSDFDGIDTNPAVPACDGLPQLFDALADVGITPRQLDKIASQNVLRVYRDVLK